jgi:hypothetical protein
MGRYIFKSALSVSRACVINDSIEIGKTKTRIKLFFYFLFLLTYFLLYYINVDETGAYTYTIIVYLLSHYVFKGLFSIPTLKFNNKTLIVWFALYVPPFIMVYSSESVSLMQVFLDSLLMSLFLLSFLKFNKQIKIFV